jgi:hypothetical protein
LVPEGVYFGSEDSSSIQFLNFASGKIKPVITSQANPGEHLGASPDGRWLLYTQLDRVDGDLMLVEGFR